jgi:hypothetical protein
VLLDREAADRATLSSVAILKLCARPIPAEKLMLDMEREIANPPGYPHRILVGRYGPVRAVSGRNAGEDDVFDERLERSC